MLIRAIKRDRDIIAECPDKGDCKVFVQVGYGRPPLREVICGFFKGTVNKKKSGLYVRCKRK